MRFLVEPSLSRISLSFMTLSSLPVDNAHEVLDLLDHAANCRRVFQGRGAVKLVEFEADQRLALLGLAADRRADLLNGDGGCCGSRILCHCQSLPYASAPAASLVSASRRRACSVETFRPRRAATERGLSSFLSASKVARTRLYGFDEPSDFETTSCMPRVSNTARIGPPAMMPVPCGAARSTTLPAPWRPWTSWWSVRPSRSATRIIARFAASVALRIASGTSRALPWPKPTRPFWSPTTTRAAKPKRRPPFTTLATRLMWTRRSTNSPSPALLRSSWRPPPLASLAMSPSHLRGRRSPLA